MEKSKIEHLKAYQKSYHKVYYEKNRDKLIAYQKAYYEANKEKVCAYMKAYMKASRLRKKIEGGVASEK